jgi:ribosomal protein L7Ae-like RNA K-turn-binding protein
MGTVIVPSANKCKETGLPYEILMDEEDLPKIAGLELVAYRETGNRTCLSVMYRRHLSSGNSSYITVSRLIAGIENTSPSKVVIHFENDNHLDLRRKNMKLMTPGNYRKLVLEKKHGRTLSLQFSAKGSC